MNLVAAALISCLTGYLLGSVNSAVLVSRLLYQKDIRREGSGNAGMTNMLRVFGKKAALITTLGDLAKAILAVVLARQILRLSPDTLPIDPGYLTGLFVLVGHIFPLYFAFRGGKGVMPALGIVLMVNPPAFLILLALAIPTLLISRTMSVVSLISAALLPPVTLVLGLFQHRVLLWETVLTLVYALLVIVSHRENIKRLFHGLEKPLGGGQNMDDQNHS